MVTSFGDVSGDERTETDDARRLAAIVESSSDAIVGKTTDGIITSWNGGAEALYGYARWEAVGWPVEMLIPPDRAGEEHDMIARLLAGKRIREFETERQRKDGTRVAVSLTASLITGVAGEVLGVATIARDMTERRAAEDALRETNARLLAMFRAANDAILVVDPAADRILDANPRACQLLEYDRDELLETRLSTIHGHELERFGPFVEECLRRGFGRNSELSCRTRTGRIIPTEVSASTVELAEGTALLAVVRDVTERREAEAVQERLAAIVEASVDAIVGFDLDGVITSWNPAAWRLFGYLPADMVGRHVSVLVPPESRGAQERIFARALREGVVRDWKTEAVRHDGSLVPVSLALSLLLDPAGAPTGVAGVIRDQSERQRYETERDIAETLQRILLPEESPDFPGLAVATRYFPGGAGLQVGGDWYDVFALPGRRLGVAVGDVVGRGVGAAAVMGQLRVALRAYALEFSSPATVLACLGRLAQSLDDSQMATVLYGVVDPDDASIVLASAGHPPPLMVRANGDVGFLDVDGAPPLGVLESPPTQVVERLEPGCLLLLYTDGLIERRGASIEDGMATVARAAAGAADVEMLCERVSEAMSAEGCSDDVALLALSLVPAPNSDTRASQPVVSQTAPQAAPTTNNVVVVRLTGDIDVSTADEAKHTLLAAAAGGATGMVIDLSTATFLDSPGVNVLFLVARRLEQEGQRGALVVPPGSFLRKVLSVTALDRLVPLFANVSDAVAALGTKP